MRAFLSICFKFEKKTFFFEKRCFHAFNKNHGLKNKAILLEEMAQKRAEDIAAGIEIEPPLSSPEAQKKFLKDTEEKLQKSISRLIDYSSRLGVGRVTTHTFTEIDVPVGDGHLSPITDLAQVTMVNENTFQFRALESFTTPMIGKTLKEHDRSWMPQDVGGGIIQLVIPKMDNVIRKQKSGRLKAMFWTDEKKMLSLQKRGERRLIESIKSKDDLKAKLEKFNKLFETKKKDSEKLLLSRLKGLED
eukprot:GHVL01000198.1.p1 GENE.GHVL01000198.1~~GHVL01000198.1.p1  ORF type:complete len:247 (+),score=50.98 GHVL01000198.1:53-793(+)